MAGRFKVGDKLYVCLCGNKKMLSIVSIEPSEPGSFAYTLEDGSVVEESVVSNNSARPIPRARA